MPDGGTRLGGLDEECPVAAGGELDITSSCWLQSMACPGTRTTDFLDESSVAGKIENASKSSGSTSPDSAELLEETAAPVLPPPTGEEPIRAWRVGDLYVGLNPVLLDADDTCDGATLAVSSAWTLDINSAASSAAVGADLEDSRIILL